MSATHAFYGEQRLGVTIDGTNTLSFTMTRRTVGLTGTVENTAGGTVSGATVRVLDGPSAGATATSDSSGVYRFGSLLAGNANVAASASGFNEDRRGVVVNGTNTQNFRITQTTPTISFTATRITGGGGAVPQEWRFEATIAGTLPSAVLNYDWDFGDGSSASESRPTEQHIYRVRGTFTVRVTANLANGTTITATREIRTDTYDPERARRR